MRITFLVRNIWGIGGTIKTTLNTAEALASLGHEVVIASCVRHKEQSDFAIDPRVKVVNLWDVRKPEEGGEKLSLLDRYRQSRPSFLDADKVNNMGESSLLLDKRVERFLSRLDTDVLVSTQVSLNLYVARYGKPGAVKIAQEHLYLDAYKPPVLARILDQYGKFDAIVTITQADAKNYREALPEAADKIVCIPNSIPGSELPPSDLTEPVIMSAGRLTGMKGFDILIPAFAQIAGRFPEWSVRIYGRGPDRKKLQNLIEQHDLRGRVELMGPVTPLDEEWRKASIAVVPSRFEPFGLVIVEAMAAGLPIVCSAAKYGPLEIVENEVNGLLVKRKDPAKLAEAMARLMDDPQLRHKLAAAGRTTAADYEPEQVVGKHVELFERLLAARS